MNFWHLLTFVLTPFILTSFFDRIFNFVDIPFWLPLFWRVFFDIVIFFFFFRYNHIASFEAAGRKQFPKASKDAASYTAGGAAAAADDDDDDVDLFGSDDEEEDAEAAKIRQERLDAYAAKKSKKPALIAKTSVLLDIKPWDDETDMNEMLKQVKTIEMDGLVWGASKLVPVGYGINKLSVSQMKCSST